MRVTWGLERAEFHPSTITTLGSYDGVHLGHRKILARLNEAKAERGLERSLVLTFHPHPQEVLRSKDHAVRLLTTIEERIELLAETGVDELVIIEFTTEFSKTSYIDFFTKTLVEGLGTRSMVVGFNHAFGKNREGDAEHLKTLAPSLGVTIEEVPPLEIEGVSLSSTKIRRALESGELALANRFLGRHYDFSGIVETGQRLGRTLGYPTANLAIPSNKLVPADGVYAVYCYIDGERYQGALSIGTKPTFGPSDKLFVEAFLLDFDRDIYDRVVKIECVKYLRPQEAFSSPEALQSKIELDVQQCRQILQ